MMRMRRMILSMGVAAALVAPAAASASVINVSTTDDQIVGVCGLRGAVVSAITNMQSGTTCVAGSGNDEIHLAANTTYNLTLTGAANTSATSGDLDIADAAVAGAVTIESPGGTVIDASGLGDVTPDRVFDVLTDGSLTLSGVSIRGGDDQVGDEHGGGIRNDGVFAMSNGDISGNSATHGGGLYDEGTSATLTNVTVSGNSASSRGSGVYQLTGGTTKLFSSTVSGNLVTEGAYAAGGAVQITNSIVSGNLADDCGGGVESNGTSARGSGCPGGGDIGPGDLPIGADLKLGLLADNGGGSLTYALLPGSPAIDAGAGCPATDQRGIARPLGSACDIGAYEAPALPTPGGGGNPPVNPPVGSRCPKGKKLKKVKTKSGKKKKKCVKKKKRKKKK